MLSLCPCHTTWRGAAFSVRKGRLRTVFSCPCWDSSLSGRWLAVVMADCHWEGWGALKDKLLFTDECMAPFGGWWHRFTTKWETLSWLEERAKEPTFVWDREPWLGTGGICELGLRALTQVFRLWKHCLLPTWCYADVSCHLPCSVVGWMSITSANLMLPSEMTIGKGHWHY